MVSNNLIFIYIIGTLVTIGTSISVVALKPQKKLNIGVVKALIVFLVVFLLAGQLLKYYANKNYLDFTVWLQILYNISEGYGPVSAIQEATIPGTGHWFASHFTPFIYLFGAIFFLWPQPETLIVCHWAAMVSTIWAAFLYGKHWFGSRECGWIVACVLCLFPTYQYIMLYEFEMLRFCMPLFILTFLFFERKQTGLFWLFLCLTLLVREEVGITAFCWGAYVVFFEKGRRWTGIMMSVVSIAYFLFVYSVIMPLFSTSSEPTHVAASAFSALGTTPSEVVLGIFKKPLVFLKLIFDPIKLANIFLYFLPLSFLPLLSPVAFAASGNMGMGLLSGAYPHTSYFLYYLSPSIPFLFIAMVKSIKSLGAFLERRIQSLPTNRGTTTALYVVLATALTANLFFGPSPLSLQFWFRDYKLAPFRTHDYHYSQYITTAHDRVLREIIKMVPQDAIVSAEQHILPLLFDRKGLMAFPELSGANYVVINKAYAKKTGIGTVSGSWDGLRQNPQFYYDWVEKDPRWSLVAQEQGCFVFKLTDLGPLK